MIRTSSVVLLGFGLLALACGSSHGQDGSQNGATNNFNVGTEVPLGDAGTLNVTYEDGEASLTKTQVDGLKGSACTGWAGEGENLPAILDFVVDVSGSMGQTAPTTGSQTKWAITRTALLGALDTLPATTAVGMIFFPNMDTRSNTTGARADSSSCLKWSGEIPIAELGDAGSAQRKALADGINAAKVTGGTPTDDAYEYELANNMGQTQLIGQKFMVLITDGQPTFSKGCYGSGRTSEPVDYQPIVNAITGAANLPSPVKTFIIGSPGSEEQAATGDDGRDWLSHAAAVGQTPLRPCSDSGPNYCHFDMSQVPDFAKGFEDALAQIAGQIISCSYTMPKPPPNETLNPANINVILTTGAGEYRLLQRSTTSTCTNGWYLDSNNTVVLCTNTCNKAKSDPSAALDLLFGCATVGGPVT